jgi:hypothetical protein
MDAPQIQGIVIHKVKIAGVYVGAKHALPLLPLQYYFDFNRQRMF